MYLQLLDDSESSLLTAALSARRPALCFRGEQPGGTNLKTTPPLSGFRHSSEASHGCISALYCSTENWAMFSIAPLLYATFVLCFCPKK